MSKHVEIKNNRPRIYTANGVTLQPGLNTLTAAQAKEFLAHPHIKIKQERGIIEVRGAAKAPTGDDAAKQAAAQAKADKDAEKQAKAAAKQAEKDAAAADAKALAEKEAAEATGAQETADAEKAEADAAEAAAAKAAAEADEGEAFEEPPYGIAGLNADDSIAKIKVIEDVDYLKVVAGREDRTTVVAAAEKRVAELESK
jgi:cell wall-associated NlpC family hydrolase